MSNQTKQPLSTAYQQLAGIFQTLEQGKLEPDLDFGANITACFGWYLSPKALLFLEKKHDNNWMHLKYNSQFVWKYNDWGNNQKGVDINLNV